MTRSKRAFDLGIAIVLSGVLVVPFALVLLVHAVAMGRPFFYRSERMAAMDRPFMLWKLRSMHASPLNAGVSGGDKASRIPVWGRFLRRSHLDEVPQLWNVLRGDMSMVGPRPPLRQYVERFPRLYAEVLRSRPGMTGLATLIYGATEARLLSQCQTPAMTDQLYSLRCVPRKARLDMIYLAHRGLRMDAWILTATIRSILTGVASRSQRTFTPQQASFATAEPGRRIRMARQVRAG
jgi:lipopolysaccharide/colanic/teichoic acid biosynthesis glycosyltransferase